MVIFILHEQLSTFERLIIEILAIRFSKTLKVGFLLDMYRYD